MNILDKAKELADSAIDATISAGSAVVHAAENLTGLDINNDGHIGDNVEETEVVDAAKDDKVGE